MNRRYVHTRARLRASCHNSLDISHHAIDMYGGGPRECVQSNCGSTEELTRKKETT